MQTSFFSKKDLAAGSALIKANKISQVLFSEGTYQIQVGDLQSKQRLWPFLQLDDVGSIIDCFCTCAAAEKKKSCCHLAAAYLKIFNGKSYPLHVRFRNSLWNRLCQIASRRHGYDRAELQKKAGGFETFSITGKRLFAVKGLTPQGKKKIETMILHREVETEETSLKFSNLSPEELQLWRQGRPSHHLQYELSFWSDLAKWWMLLQEENEKYTIVFDEKEQDRLPHWIEIQFEPVSAHFYIAEVNWPQIIESLSMVHSSLPVFEFQQHKIEAIRYDPEKASFLIQSAPLDHQMDFHLSAKLIEEAIPIGDWIYLPKKGFFPSVIDPIFNQPEISRDKVGSVLQKHVELIEKYLVNAKIHPAPVKANYTIFFDENDNLHVRLFVFSPEDLMHKRSCYFGPWVYVDPQGFYLLENLLFQGQEKIIARARMNDFINRHRAWLNGFLGFQTHVFTIESNLRYTMQKEGFLLFETTLDFTDLGGEFIDFGEWIYLKDKGFFAKKMGKAGAFFRPGVPIPASDISSFIKVHKEELEHIPEFFAKKSPLDKSGLEIYRNEQGSIVVRPRFSFYSVYPPESVQIYGDYTYVAAEGFYEIPSEKKLPITFLEERTIKPEDEPYFVLYELDTLKPYILSIQKELTKPSYLSLRIHSMKKAHKAHAAEWIVQALFETDVGSISLYEVWKAVTENKRYLFSSGGLIILRPPRFNWLKNIPKRRWIKDGKCLKLSTMDWMRVCVLEEVLLPEGRSSEEEKTRNVIQTLQNFKTEDPIDLTGLQSELRSYQEVGVRWLYFLSLHGLSGLLCDEMGLGKTHQAMGLLTAVANKNMKNGVPVTFLVVCPTSVIYHWEDLLKRFLPSLRIVVFYGTGRSLEHFKDQGDLLLTSYGTLRSEKQPLSSLSFDVAIFDEVQIAKNAHSQTHKALKQIDALTRIGLTGTPIENRLLELKALFDIVLPGYMPQEAQFKEYFVNPIERNQDLERKILLSRLTKPFILRRKKTEVLLELPEKIEEIALCTLSDEQKELYKKTYLQHREAALKDIGSEGATLPFAHIFSLFSTLKQICDHPCLITKQYDEYHKHRSGKWDLFVELLQEVRDSGQKLVIFSQYLGMLDLFAAYLKENKIGFTTIRGSTRDRKTPLDLFRNDPQCEVFLASLQAAGVGIDLVSASVVIHYDRWWNPARENQATDRVHRIGQNRGVQVFKMVTKDTIEEHIHRMIEKKMTLLEDVISFDEQDHIKGFNRQEILELLRVLDQDVEEKL